MLNDTAVIASGTVGVGAAVAFIKGLFQRTVSEMDVKIAKLTVQMENLEKDFHQAQREADQLRGIVQAESFGLVAVVKRLDGSVEKLTESVQQLIVQRDHTDRERT